MASTLWPKKFSNPREDTSELMTVEMVVRKDTGVARKQIPRIRDGGCSLDDGQKIWLLWLVRDGAKSRKGSDFRLES